MLKLCTLMYTDCTVIVMKVVYMHHSLAARELRLVSTLPNALVDESDVGLSRSIN